MKIYDKSYYCFGCHSGGKAVSFIQNFYNLSFKDACRKLNIDFRLGLDDVIDWRISETQKRILRAKIESEKIKQEELERVKRIADGHIECTDIDIEYQDKLYDMIVEPSFNQRLEECGLGEFVDHSDYKFEKPKVLERFRFELVGTKEFDDLLDEYGRKAHALWKQCKDKLLKKEGSNE
jgi:hypothetical protein